ncbi:MAG: N-acetylmuramoyl-L-alanine amidase [Bacteroidaceae bacterium]|nr:N-acetylmuramoyl-L-alanine amidase [Bacteroidaceae bacterium]
MRNISEIIVHCSATPEGRDVTVKDIDAWHRKRGFKCIGYHYVIYRDGSIHQGRPEEEHGAHCKEGGHNRHSIGVCYIGGMTADMKKDKDTRTPEQQQALIALLKELKARYPNATIHGHRDFAARACPSFDARAEYRSLVATILLVFSCLLFSSCRTTKRVVEEKTDCEVLQTLSQSVTSSATDKFLQNIVLHIDSIVFTSLSMPQVSEGNDSFLLGLPKDISGSKSCAPETRTRNSSLRSGAGGALPLNAGRGTKILISGIRLQSTTADSSSSTTAVSSEGNLQASGRSLAKAKEAKKPSTLTFYWIVFLIIIAIAVAVAFAVAKKTNPFRTAVRFILQKVLT